MNAIHLILLFITNVFWLQAQESLNTTSTSTELISFEGVGDIKVYKTTLKDLKAKYPDCKIERYREQLGFGFSEAARSVSIENRGISCLLERKKWFGSFYVRTIIMDSTFTGTTAGGAGIGSTYGALKAAFADGRFVWEQSKYEKVSLFSCSVRPSDIYFRCFQEKPDRNTFKVEQIMIWGWAEDW